MRILIVEDEKKTVTYLHKGLTEQGFVVDVSAEGEEGLLLATTLEYDLIVLDVMVSLRDGWSVLKELRLKGVVSPNRRNLYPVKVGDYSPPCPACAR